MSARVGVLILPGVHVECADPAGCLGIGNGLPERSCLRRLTHPPGTTRWRAELRDPDWLAAVPVARHHAANGGVRLGHLGPS